MLDMNFLLDLREVLKITWDLEKRAVFLAETEISKSSRRLLEDGYANLALLEIIVSGKVHGLELHVPLPITNKENSV